MATLATPRPCPREAEIVDHFAAVRGRVFLRPGDDLLHDDIEAAVAFYGVLSPVMPASEKGKVRCVQLSDGSVSLRSFQRW